VGNGLVIDVAIDLVDKQRKTNPNVYHYLLDDRRKAHVLKPEQREMKPSLKRCRTAEQENKL
jgi:hypothetical protein